MRYLVWLGILVGMLSCAFEPYGTTRSGQINAGDAGKGASVAEGDGEDWPFIHKDGNVKWRLSQDKITIGQVFSVRVDVDVADEDVGLSFKLVECGDFFVARELYALGKIALAVVAADETSGATDYIRGVGVPGVPGIAQNLVIIDGDGTSGSLPPDGACKLQVENVFYPKGTKISSSLKLQLQASPLELVGVNLDDFRRRLITATVKTPSDFFKSFSAAKGKKIARFKVCPHAGDYPCIGSAEMSYSSDMLQYDADSNTTALAVDSLKFGADSGKKYPDLAEGKYWIMATLYERETEAEEPQEYVHAVVTSSIKLTSQ